MNRLNLPIIGLFICMFSVSLSAKAEPQVDNQYFLEAMSCSISGQSCLAISSDQTNENTAFLIYSSEDAGNTWSKINTLPIPINSDLAISNFHCDEKFNKDCTLTVYKIMDPQYPDQTFHTFDGGLTWKASMATSGIEPDKIASVACDENNVHCLSLLFPDFVNDQLVAKVLQSENGGEAWTFLQPVTNPSNSTKLACDRSLIHCMVQPVSPASFCLNDRCTASTQINLTHNGAFDWHDIKFNWDYSLSDYPLGSDFSIDDIFCDRNSCAHGLISGIFGNYPMILLTNDQGEHWTAPILLPPLPKKSAIPGRSIVKCDTSMKNCLAVYSTRSGDLKNAFACSYTSKDGGLTWKGPYSFGKPLEIKNVYCDLNGSKCVAISDDMNRVISNDGGITWSTPQRISTD